MMIAFTDEQEQLRDALRRLFTDTCATSEGRLERDLDAVRPKVTGALAATGMAGLPFAEQFGGAGAGLAETAVLFHEGGRALCPSAVYTTLVAGLAVQAAGTPEVQRRWLPALAGGELIATVALWSPDDAHDIAAPVRATDGPDGLTLSGTVRFVENAPLAEVVVLAVDNGVDGADDGVVLVTVRPGTPGCAVKPVAALGRDPLGNLTLDGYVVPTADLIGDLPTHALRRLADTVVALQCVEMVGGATRVVEDTVAYVKQREQFGRPIGSFQAVQHIIADLRIALDVARLTAWRAVDAATGDASAGRAVAIAKLQANKAYPRTTLQCHQLMGGMGFLRESDLHLWSERAKISELRNGSVQVALGWLADRVGAAT